MFQLLMKYPFQWTTHTHHHVYNSVSVATVNWIELKLQLTVTMQPCAHTLFQHHWSANLRVKCTACICIKVLRGLNTSEERTLLIEIWLFYSVPPGKYLNSNIKKSTAFSSIFMKYSFNITPEFDPTQSTQLRKSLNKQRINQNITITLFELCTDSFSTDAENSKT